MIPENKNIKVQMTTIEASLSNKNYGASIETMSDKRNKSNMSRFYEPILL